MNFLLHRRWVLALGIVCAVPMWAPGRAVLSLDRLTTTADAIVVGRILRGNVASGIASMDIEVETSIKGDAGATSILAGAIGSLSLASSRPAQIPPQRGVFFMKRTPSRGWAITPIVNGYVDHWIDLFIPLTATAPTADTRAAVATDRVLLHLLASAEAGQTNFGPSFVLTRAVARSQSAEVRAVVRRLLSSQSGTIRSLGFRLAAASADESVLPMIEAEAAGSRLTPAEAASLGQLIGSSYATPSPSTINALGRLATHPSATFPLKHGAATALAWIHSQSSLRYLAQLLESPDTQLQAAGVAGLAMFANNMPIRQTHAAPGPWKFRSEATVAHTVWSAEVMAREGPKYLGFWRAWWHENRQELAGQ